MRRMLLSAITLLACVSVSMAAERHFSFGGAKDGQGVSLEILDRYTVRLTVIRPTYEIAPTTIKLSQPIAMDRPNMFKFSGETEFGEGTLRVRGRWLDMGTKFEGDDISFVTWVYSGNGPQDSPEDDVDDEILESEDEGP